MLYLLHFDRPFHHAKHYLGFANDLDARVKRHFSGHGSKLMKAVIAAGIKVEVARTWENGDRNLERKLHNQNNGPRLCPICRGKK